MSAAIETSRRRPTAVFVPVNSAGHMNSSVAIADQLKQQLGYRTVFVMVGPPLGTAIQSHGHELVQIPESQPLEDYEIEAGEDPGEPDEERKLREGKTKRKFLGAERWPQLFARLKVDFGRAPAESSVKLMQSLGSQLATIVMDNAKAVGEAVEALEPDVIVSDSYLPQPCLLLHERTRPWVRLHSANPLVLVEAKPGVVKAPPGMGLSLLSRQERDHMRTREPERWTELMNKWKELNERMRDFTGEESYKRLKSLYQSHGVEALRDGEQLLNSPYLNIYLYPEALDYDQESDLFHYSARMLRCDSLMRQVAGSIEEKEAAHWRAQIEARHPDQVIFFSLGSIASGNPAFVRRHIEILSKDQTKGRLYIVSKGHCGDQIELNERNMIGANYVPQPYLLQRSHLAIIHGGNNSVTECLYFGLPMIVLPNFFDQLDNAQRIQDLQLGRRLNVADCSPEKLLATINELLEDEPLRQRARAIGEQMRRRDELAKIALIVDKLAREKCLSEEFISDCRAKRSQFDRALR